MITINQDTRQLNIPGDDLVFGVEFDAGSERKRFQCPRYVGDNLDLASCFVRINIRNANGDLDSYLVDDVTVDGDNVVFSWVLSEKAVKFKGQLKFVVCAVGPNHKVEWHTTLGTGMVLEGLEPEIGTVEAETADVVAQLIAMVELQTTAVENIGAEWVRNVQSEGADQVIAVQTAARVAQSDAVAEIEAKGVNTLGSIPEDYTALQSAVDALAHTRGAAIVCEAAGSAVIVNDASDNYIQGLRIFGRSTQDGTPTPDAPVEIKSVENPKAAVCGKNLFNKNAAVENRGVSTSSGTLYANDTLFTTDFILCGGARNIATNMKSSVSGFLWGAFYDSRKIYTSGFQVNCGDVATIEIPYDAKYIRISCLKELLQAAVVNLGSEILTTEAYVDIQSLDIAGSLHGIPVASGGNYTDGNGQQWICDEVDLGRGVYVQRVKTVILNGSSAEAWTLYNNNPAQGTCFVYYPHDGVISFRSSLCDKYQNVNGCWGEPYREQMGIYSDHNSVSGRYFRPPIESVDSLEAWLAWLAENPLTFMYARATPVETALDDVTLAAFRELHSNKPTTTLLNDAGAHMVVKYAADTKLYIDNKIAALTAKV